jgi:hypothetical protein
MNAMLTFTPRNVYGETRYYPANDQAKALMNLVGQKTLTATVKRDAEAMGFQFVMPSPDTLTWVALRLAAWGLSTIETGVTEMTVIRHFHQHTLPTLAAGIGGEPVRYASYDRWSWNNGFRRHWLNKGARHAAAINAARDGDLAALIAFAGTIGGLRQKLTFARSAIKEARKLAEDVPPYRVVNCQGRRMVQIADLTWDFQGSRQVANIGWMLMWGTESPCWIWPDLERKRKW